MIKAYVGSGGKTTLIKNTAKQYLQEGKSVLITTTTHMFREDYALVTDDPQLIIEQLERTGFAMAGLPAGEKIKALSLETYETVCQHADVVLVEADGSKHLPLKYPNATEPVIPDNVDEIIVVCGLNALEHPAKEVCHRLELVKSCLGIDDDTIITPSHIQKLVQEGYLAPLRQTYPHKKITLAPRHNGSIYQRVIASLLTLEQDPSIILPEWFCPQPKLVICGGGHVSKEVAALASRLEFYTKVIDDRPEIMNEDRFPTANEVICASYDDLPLYLEPDACYVVVTPNHKADYQCVASILPSSYSYLGMIGSHRKVADTFERLKSAGFSEEQISTVHAPIGLPIGAVTPAEIAVSIMAQIIQKKNKHHASSIDKAILECTDHGVLCIIIQKQGSTPRGVGSMMLVTKDSVLGSIGGGESEYLAICHAKENPSFAVKEYKLNNTGKDGLDMVCGGKIQVMFVPL